MANYSIIADSTFKPFSYSELMAPVLHQQQVQDKLTEEYDKISSQADILEAMGTNDKDNKTGTYSRFKAYSDAVRAEADNLYAHGLNSESRRRLSELRRRYNTEIVPIQNAWNKREEEAKMQTKAMMDAAVRGIDLRFSRNAADSPIQSYIDNPNQTFRVINGQQITTEVANQFKGLASQIQQDKDGNYLLKGRRLNPIEYDIIRKKGMDYNQYMDFINNPDDPQYASIRGIIENTLRAHHLEDFDHQTQADMFNYGAMGVSAGIGTTDAQLHKDAYEDKTLDYQIAVAKERAKKEDELDIPNWAEERTKIKTADGYVDNAPEIMSSLKVGHDALKSSIFGKYTNSVNPLAIYEDYQRELVKNQKESTASMYSPSTGTMVYSTQKVPDNEAAKKAVIRKYSKYGVSDILTTEQYNLLKSMGYDNKSRFTSRYSDINKRLNSLATQYTRYSTKMSGYDLPDEAIRTSVFRMGDKQFKSGMMWDLKEDGSIGTPITSKSDLDLKTNDNTKGNQVTDIQYDPQHKGKILITFSGGNNPKRVIANPDIIDAQLTKAIKMWENAKVGNQIGYDPRIITGKISEWLNTYNKQQGKTGDK